MAGKALFRIYWTSVIAIACFVLVASHQERPPPDNSVDSVESKAAALVDKLSQSCDNTQILGRFILHQIEENTKFEERLHEHSVTQEYITKYQVEQRNSLHEKEPLIAFSARVTTHLNGLSPSQTIVFGSAVTNLGNAYDTDTGIFRCPVDGVYQFYVSLVSQKSAAIEAELAVNGEEKMLLLSASNGGLFGTQGSGTVILQLQTGDEVLVRVHLHYGNYVHCCWSRFTGYLLKAQ